MLRQFNLLQMKDRQIDTLSGGERRRLALATLMIQDPAIWLMDEPTNHLDMHHQISLLQLVTAYIDEHKRSAVYVLHDVNLVTRFCSHVLMMLQQETLAGPVNEVMTRDNIQRLFQHEVTQLDNAGSPVFIAG